jgi:carbonic anhydrase
MSSLNYPNVEEYNLPKKNILVLSCMDLRLTDNLVDFLNFDNLHNRYDHFILAGTSLLTTEKKRGLFLKGIYEKYAHWDQSLKDHIKLAKDLHKIEDVYIVEHEDCGAYSNLLDPSKVDLSSREAEIKCHKDFAIELAEKIFSEFKLNTHCFIIDLRGNVTLLQSQSINTKKTALNKV